MALEDLTGTKYLDDLNSSNPVAGDNVSEGDDHIRGIKNVLKLTFPNIDAACNVTPTELNLIDGGTARGTDALASGDGILINDGGTMKMTNVDTVQTFMEADSLQKAGGTMTGAVVGATDTDTSNSGTVDLDFTANTNFVLTLTGNVTSLTASNEVAGQSGFIVFIQDGTGGRTVALHGDYETAAAAGLTLTATASATDIVPYVVAASSRILLGAPQLAFA